MKSFEYIIKDPLGVHARPAGLLVKKSSSYSSAIQIRKDDKCSDGKRIFAIMSMGIKCNDKITVEISGDDEEKAASDLAEFFEENL